MRNSIFPLTKIIALWNLALKSTSCQFRSATLSTKIGLSSGAVTVLSSLRDELPEFRPKALERIVSVRRILEVSRDLNEGEIKSVQSWHRCLIFCHHLITLSARYSIDCGMLRPICLAVLRLITSSNFVGRSTGRSAGLAPLRVWATEHTTRRELSPMCPPPDRRPPASIHS